MSVQDPRSGYSERENLYAEQINPLMQQVTALCREHEVPFFYMFEMDEKTSFSAILSSPSASKRFQWLAHMVDGDGDKLFTAVEEIRNIMARNPARRKPDERS
jgi:hypothetical protein